MNRNQRRAQAAVASDGNRVVIFRREGMWYPLELPADADLAKHAELNPGTLSIEDALTGEVLWRPQ